MGGGGGGGGVGGRFTQSVNPAVVYTIGQVRSECLTCIFRARCCSSRLSRAQVPDFAGSSLRDREKRGGSKGEPPALAGTRDYEHSDRNR